MITEDAQHRIPLLAQFFVEAEFLALQSESQIMGFSQFFLISARLNVPMAELFSFSLSKQLVFMEKISVYSGLFQIHLSTQ